MSKIVNYTDEPADIAEALESADIVSDFLPSPEKLVRKVEKEKITIAIDKNSLGLYKRYAKTHNAKYQTMMNGVLDAYANKFLNEK